MTTATTKFTTARDVANAIASLGYHATQETLAAISRNCREDFLEHLANCVSGQDEDGASKRAIGNLIRCLAPETINRLKSINPNVTIDSVVPVAKTHPAKLLSAIDAACAPEHERHQDAKDYLELIFSPANPEPGAEAPENPTSRPEQTPEPTRTGREQAERPVGQSQAPQHSTSDERPSERGSKKFNSCHVYGSGYALCFNAGEWEGKRGVMVDAAVSSGTKAYDWKNALHLWLDINEVGAVLAVFRRWRKGIEFNAHGAANDKSFAIEFQGQHFYAKVQSRKSQHHPTRAVKILPTDATEVSILFLTQLADSYPAIPLNELLATVRATHQISDATT
jgi:hypothetical protein